MERSLCAHGIPVRSSVYNRPCHTAQQLWLSLFLHPSPQTVESMKIRTMPTSSSSFLRKRCFCSDLSVPPTHRSPQDSLSHLNKWIWLRQWFSTRGNFAPWTNLWQCLDTHLVVTTGLCCWHPVGRRPRCPKHPTRNKTSPFLHPTPWPHQKIIHQKSIALRLRLPVLSQCLHDFASWMV